MEEIKPVDQPAVMAFAHPNGDTRSATAESATARSGPSTALVTVLGAIAVAGLFFGLLVQIPKGAAAGVVTASALAILFVGAL